MPENETQETPATLSDIDTSLVTTGKPVEGGCCWTCFNENPTLPTDAATKMSTLGFESLGELSTNGFTEGTSVTSNDFRGWHGSVILTEIDEATNTYKVEFVEPNRPTVAKLRYGAENIEIGEDGSVSHIKGKVNPGAKVPLVFDELESNGYLRRTVVRKAAVKDFDDTPHQKGNLLVYGMTFTAIEVEGQTFDIYRAKPAKA